MLVNIGAQACVGQLQDTVLLRNVCKYQAGQAAPSCSEMELNHAMLQAILEGTQITATTVQWWP